MASYGIIRVEKVKMAKITSNLQSHHQRESSNGYYNNSDIDITKKDDNVEFIHSDNFRESVNQKIKEFGITRKIRPDAVGLLDGFVTVSGDFFKGKTKEQIVSFFEGIIPLIEKELGPIISCTLHGDEMKYNNLNYHMHFATVPIVSNEKGKYTLSAKKIMGNQKDYVARQDRFHKEYFQKFGLKRGVSAKETQRTHVDTNRWKSEQAEKMAANQTKLLSDTMQEQTLVQLENNKIKKENDKIKQDTLKKQDELNKLNRQIENLKNIIQQNSNEIDKQKQQLIKTDNQLKEKIYNLNGYNELLQNKTNLIKKSGADLQNITQDITKQQKELESLKSDIQYIQECTELRQYLEENEPDFMNWYFGNEQQIQQSDEEFSL